MLFRLMIATVLALFCLPAHAADRVSVGHLRAQVPVVHVTTLISRQDEAKEDFLRRLGGLMAAYTERTGFEICGSIFAGSGRVGVALTTSLAHSACATTDKSPGMGMSMTGDSIHSHPIAEIYIVNSSDAIFSGFRHRKNSRQRADPRTFSRQDYAAGSGYLVTGGQLLYQSGRGTERVLGQVQAADPAVINSIVAMR